MLDAQTKHLMAQAKMLEAQAKSGGEGGQVRDVDAEVKLMDAETRRQDLHLKAIKMGVDIHQLAQDSEHREADRILDSHHRIADRKSQKALEIARSLKGQGMQEIE